MSRKIPRARLVEKAQDWQWSSARTHLAGRDNALVQVAPLLDRCNGRFADLLETPADPVLLSALRAAERIGRPLVAPGFLDQVAEPSGRDQRPRKRGRSRGGQCLEVRA